MREFFLDRQTSLVLLNPLYERFQQWFLVDEGAEFPTQVSHLPPHLTVVK